MVFNLYKFGKAWMGRYVFAKIFYSEKIEITDTYDLKGSQFSGPYLNQKNSLIAE